MMVDYKEVGLRVGLEVHRQLDTKCKLFCSCPTESKDFGREIVFTRWLREAQSELGEVDPAALFEAKKRRKIVYHTDDKSTCLVEMDEEPPHDLNPEAIEVALTAAILMNSNPVDEIHVMRKIVIDGSNTTGFQRTCIIAIGGWIETLGKKIPIQTICLEEDAARIIEQKKGEIHYDLRRLGVPLIEISTAPVIESPREAYEVAKYIGRLLRATGKVKRGLGTVRQDLNVSIKDGALIEIKGVQELDLIPRVIELEVVRQLHLLKIKDELMKRGVSEEEIRSQPIVDLTEIFADTNSKIVKKKIVEGGRVLALKLPKFGGLLGLEAAPKIRLGAEFAGRARAWAEVEGIFHTDELPGYGITSQEVSEIFKKMNSSSIDAVVLVVDEEDRAREALERIRERAIEALYGVPSETRAARPDGTTIYMRPRPGAARMYPETDIPPYPVKPDYLERLKKNLPPTLDEVAERLVEKYGLSKQVINELIDMERAELFEKIIQETNVQSTVVASILTEHVKSLKRDGVRVEELRDEHFLEFFKLVSEGRVAKEAAPDILRWVSENPNRNVSEAIEALGIRTVSLDELEDKVNRLIELNKEVVQKNPGKAISIIMGELMKEYRGKIDGAKLHSIVSSKVYGQTN
ncbi:MAG: Glu-tRNA(Gln) amidotransferase subunit GatE [Aigarchaeota archaeon]|nr:Glu-tRNA(Gln) amidotransferase subunit GatE [Aigarchaeota archaeon]MCX8192975.1 Glu-tRNA(Gln) amidotransferase subunit GatE [Nitrososphaeria archaeon]MDW7986289.1 Glu-tRNA(Gln) amidotransferase subunit GatE [Nitrososphaerota archaeon]